jgi:hypothetical protein
MTLRVVYLYHICLRNSWIRTEASSVMMLGVLNCEVIICEPQSCRFEI